MDSTKQAPATNTPCLEPDLPEVLYLLIARITSFCHFNASCTNHPDNDDKPPSVSRYSFCNSTISSHCNRPSSVVRCFGLGALITTARSAKIGRASCRERG